MRRLFSWQLSVLLFAGITAGAQQAPTTEPAITPGITVTGTTPPADPTLPKIAPDQFTNCYSLQSSAAPGQMDYVAMETCEAQLAADQRAVIHKCTNRDGKSAPPVIIQACTELLDRNILQGHDRFYLFVNRALAYIAQGQKQRALDDYNKGVEVAPKNAQPYYYRGVFYATQADVDAALRDFDTALSLNPKLVPALLQRARIHKTQKNFSGALEDYSEAIRLEPKAAAAWSERGYVCLLQRDFEGAVKDEAQAIQLDPKMARAYFLRGAAFGDLGDSHDAVSDVTTAVGLDPSLDRYISSKGKTATLTLPPF